MVVITCFLYAGVGVQEAISKPKMKKTGIFCILLLLSAFAVLAQPSSKAVHKALSPFVEQRQIGGVVAVVADRDKIISMDWVTRTSKTTGR